MSVLLEDKRSKLAWLNPGQANTFLCINCSQAGLALTFMVIFMVALIKFSEELAGPIAAILSFGLLFHLFLLLTTCLGCLGFANRDFTSLLLQSVVLSLLLIGFLLGAISFSVGAGSLQSDRGFAAIIRDWEASFEGQVFNDCCVNLFANGGVAVQSCNVNDQVTCVNAAFSLGDVVNDKLCLLFAEREADSFVGNELAESCDPDFAVFQQDFKGFTEFYFKVFAGLHWTAVALVVCNLIFSFYLLCFQSAKEENMYNPDGTRVESLGAQPLTVPPAFGFSAAQKQGISNFVGRLSFRGNNNTFTGNDLGRGIEPSMPPPAPGPPAGPPPPRFSMKNAFAMIPKPTLPSLPTFGRPAQVKNESEFSGFEGSGPPIPSPATKPTFRGFFNRPSAKGPQVPPKPISPPTERPETAPNKFGNPSPNVNTFASPFGGSSGGMTMPVPPGGRPVAPQAPPSPYLNPVKDDDDVSLGWD